MGKIRIKDIAMKAGVSTGTVDRVLHERPNVSGKAREKVEAVLNEMGYQPNAYASALAYNRSYNFCVIIPEHETEAYWQEIEQGVKVATNARSDFHLESRFFYFKRLDYDSYSRQCEAMLKTNPDGVILVPSTLEITRPFTEKLHARRIPFVLLDSYMPDLKPLAFYGQDSFQSGFFAAKMLMLIASHDKEIMLMRLTKDGRVLSKQQANREEGFRHYMSDHFPHIDISTFDMAEGLSAQAYDHLLDSFFKTHADIHNCITFSSKAHIVASFLLRRNLRDIQIMGYDMVKRNEQCLRRGSISFLIAQHAYMQGYFCIDCLFRAIVLRHEVKAINYMPIELLCKENVDFYLHQQL